MEGSAAFVPCFLLFFQLKPQGKNFFFAKAKKALQIKGLCGIISERDCTRYAMKREVAALGQGISVEYVRLQNRATVILCIRFQSARRRPQGVLWQEIG